MTDGAKRPPSELGRVYASPADGQKTLQSRYEYWTAKITDHSFQAAISLIAANWAVHSGGANALLQNGFALWSIFLALLTLLISLTGSLLMSHLHYKEFYRAANDKGEWDKRWKDAEINKASPWPFSHEIVSLGIWMAWSKVGIPVIATILFLLGAL